MLSVVRMCLALVAAALAAVAAVGVEAAGVRAEVARGAAIQILVLASRQLSRLYSLSKEVRVAVAPVNKCNGGDSMKLSGGWP